MKNQGHVLIAGDGMAGEQGPGKVIPVTERRYYSLIDKVYDLRNLFEAWKEVRRNKGAAGIDRVTISRFEANLESYLKMTPRATASWHVHAAASPAGVHR